MSKLSVSNFNVDNVIKIAALGLGAFAIYKIFIQKSATDKSVEKTNTDINNYVNDTLKNQTPTKSDAEWGDIANTIYNDIDQWEFGSGFEKDAVYQLARAKNDADVASLIKEFGIRQIHRFGIPIKDPMHLQAAILTWLPQSYIDTVNSNYSRKGIKFKF